MVYPRVRDAHLRSENRVYTTICLPEEGENRVYTHHMPPRGVKRVKTSLFSLPEGVKQVKTSHICLPERLKREAYPPERLKREVYPTLGTPMGIPSWYICLPGYTLVGSPLRVHAVYTLLPGPVHVDGLLGMTVMSVAPQGRGLSPKDGQKGSFLRFID